MKLSSSASGPASSHAGGLFLVEGQDFVLVFSSTRDWALDVEHEIRVFVGTGLGDGLFGVVIGIVEEPETEFDPQDLAHALVHDFHREASLFDEFPHREDEPRRGREVRAHVQTRFEHLPHGLLVGFRHGVLGVDVLHGLAVADHVAVEARIRGAAGR